MVAECVDVKTTQARVGHADVRTTLRLYALATSAADRLAADVLDRRFAAALHSDDQDYRPGPSRELRLARAMDAGPKSGAAANQAAYQGLLEWR